MIRPALLIAALFVCAASAAPAFAVEPACLWNAMPAAQRERATAAVQASGPRALTRDLFERESLGRAAVACGATVQTARTAGGALGAYVLERATAEQLERDFGVQPVRLEAAWNRLSPADRQTLLTWAGTLGQGGDQTAAQRVVAGLVVSLGLPGMRDPGFRESPQLRAAAGHFTGRAMRIALANGATIPPDAPVRSGKES